MTTPDTIFEQLVVGRWKAKGKAAINIPISRITEEYKNRIVPRDRPYKDGAKLDDIGSMAVTWELECIFFNGHGEQGVNPDNYPDDVDKLCESARVHECGDLQLPTVGPKRARLVTYRRIEASDVVDSGAVTLTFQEDSEDGVTASSFSAPSAKSVTRSIAVQAVDSAAAEGAWSDLLSSLKDAAAELEALANAPGQFADDLEAQANAIVNTVREVGDTFADAQNRVAKELVTLMTNPGASLPGRLMSRLADTAKRTSAQVLGAGRIVTRTFPREVSIFDVASQLSQPADKLMAINAGIADFLAIPAGTPVRVFDT